MLGKFFQWMSNLLSRLKSSSGSATQSPSLPSPPSSSGSASPTKSPSGKLNLNRALLMLSAEEGRRNAPYKDSEGYWTIGVGHLMDPILGGSLPDYAEKELDKNGVISEKTIDRLLEDDIIRAAETLERGIPWAVDLDQVRYTVLLDMTFQMGIGNADKGTGLLGFRNTLSYVQQGYYVRAAEGMMASLWARQTPNRARRRAEEMRTGVFHEYV